MPGLHEFDGYRKLNDGRAWGTWVGMVWDSSPFYISTTTISHIPQPATCRLEPMTTSTMNRAGSTRTQESPVEGAICYLPYVCTSP